MTKILITGRPGAGKTTVVKDVAARIKPVAGGFLTEEIREQGRRLGFRVRDIHSGETGALAHVRQKDGPRVGKYRVDVASFERIGVQALREGMGREGCIIIDEIGKMEMCSHSFTELVAEIMEGDRPVVATIPAFRHPFLDRLRERGEVELIEVTASNREGLADRLVDLLTASGARDREKS